MKTAFILTQHPERNYGGILQNYALQRVLLRFNYKSIDIDFYRKSLKRTTFELIFLNHFTIDTTCQIFSAFFKNHVSQIFYSKMNLFVKTWISIINLEKSDSAIRKLIKRKKDSIIVVGSDQVWRREFSPHLPFYFCSFLNSETKCKHITYAASFGIDNWNYTEEETQMASMLIGDFDTVSVREKSAIDLCKQHLGYEKAVWVPDPTMLLTHEEYLQLVRKPIKSEPYIATYFLNPTEEKEKMMNDVLSHFNLKRIDLSPKLQKKPLRPPEEWLATINSATYVITDSFHGTVFSILFHKQFVVLHNDYAGETRLKEILEAFNIEKRLFGDNDTQIILKVFDTPVNYEEIDDQLKVFRKIGYDFLSNILK